MGIKGGAGVAQSVKHLTSARVMISQFVPSSPALGYVLKLRAWSLLRILCLPLSLPLLYSCSVSLCLKNKTFKNNNKKEMGIKEGTCWDEHWVLHVSDESLNSTPETNIALDVS